MAKTLKVLKTAASAVHSVPAKLLLVGVFEGELLKDATTTHSLDGRTQGLLALQASEEKFSGKAGETLVAFTAKASGATRTLVFGLGARDKFDIDVLRSALTAAFRKAKALKVEEVTVEAFDLAGTGITPEQFGETVAVYSGLVAYNLNHFKTEKAGFKGDHTITSLRLIAGKNDPAAVRSGAEAGAVIASAQNTARDLVNLPPNICTPTYLAAQARKLQKQTKGAVKVTVLGKAECKKLGMNAFLAVNQGSDQQPQFIVMEYTPDNAPADKVLGLVGKSITFDSGGLDIKSADGMGTMKCDMAGGATVLAAMGAIATLQVPVKVIAVMAATENMPSGKAYKPSDVIVTMSGRTIEINNTDAEGRVTLADAVHYIRVLGATHLMDLATLTGAMITTTADVGAGLFGNNKAWDKSVLAAAEAAGEYLWPMPMWKELRDANSTPMADLSNTGAKFGGAGSSSAAMFISEFAEDTPWVHLDIAGTAYRRREFQADPAGGTGWGLRTLIELTRAFAR